MLSFLSGEPVNPQIEYYENSKKNAIATKITSKVKTTVQQSVNSSMVSTITKIASKSGELIVGDGKSGDNLAGTVVDKLRIWIRLFLHMQACSIHLPCSRIQQTA